MEREELCEQVPSPSKLRVASRSQTFNTCLIRELSPTVAFRLTSAVIISLHFFYAQLPQKLAVFTQKTNLLSQVPTMLAKLFRRSSRLVAVSTKQSRNLSVRNRRSVPSNNRHSSLSKSSLSQKCFSTTKDTVDSKESEDAPQRTFIAKANASIDVRENWVESMTPKKIVEKLDRYIIGQDKAKRAVSVSLRNRWRRQQLNEDLKKEVNPMNILMMGPTGTGKVERDFISLIDSYFEFA